MIRKFSLFAISFALCFNLFHSQNLKDRLNLEDSDYVFDLADSTPITTGNAGIGRLMDVNSFPILSGKGVALAYFAIEPCGVNLPHVHPRATEIFYVVKGTFQVGLAEENRTIVNTITAGQATIFPMGLIHEQMNIGCEEAIFIAAFSSDDPGRYSVSSRLFSLPVPVLEATFAQPEFVIKRLKKKLPSSPAIGPEECRRACGLKI